MLSATPNHTPDPAPAIRQEFCEKLLKRLNEGDAGRRYGFKAPHNLGVVQVDQARLTGHIYGLLVDCERGVIKAEGLPAIAPFIQHILGALASALDDCGVAVYSRDASMRGKDGNLYAGKAFLVFNPVSKTNNPVAPILEVMGQTISGNLPERQNLYQITLIMQQINPGPVASKVSLFVDRLPYNDRQEQVITDDLVALQVGPHRDNFARYHAQPIKEA